MKLKYDFVLSHRFGVLEKLIYRMVINGVSSVKIITALLPIFSEEVIAFSIRKLVNAQLLSADIGTKTVSLSEVSLLLIDACAEKKVDVDVSDEFIEILSEANSVVIDDPQVTAVILKNLLPDVRTSFLSGTLDFVVLRGESNE